MNKARRKLLVAGGLFWAVVGAVLLLNGRNCLEAARPWFIGNSISWYVGSRVWSALIFAISNAIVAILMSQFLWALGEYWQMPRPYFFFIVLLVISLVWLSVFPLGFFDQADAKSLISSLHEAGSRTMFGSMAVVAIFLATRVRTHKVLHGALVLFPFYALVCAVAFLTKNAAFYSAILIFESLYIFLFMALILWCGNRAKTT